MSGQRSGRNTGVPCKDDKKHVQRWLFCGAFLFSPNPAWPGLCLPITGKAWNKERTAPKGEHWCWRVQYDHVTHEVIADLEDFCSRRSWRSLLQHGSRLSLCAAHQVLVPSIKQMMTRYQTLVRKTVVNMMTSWQCCFWGGGATPFVMHKKSARSGLSAQLTTASIKSEAPLPKTATGDNQLQGRVILLEYVTRFLTPSQQVVISGQNHLPRSWNKCSIGLCARPEQREDQPLSDTTKKTSNWREKFTSCCWLCSNKNTLRGLQPHRLEKLKIERLEEWSGI